MEWEDRRIESSVANLAQRGCADLKGLLPGSKRTQRRSATSAPPTTVVPR